MLTGMKLYSWNVNGIRAVEKKGLLEPFLTKHQPDVLCIQETKAQPEQVQEQFASHYPQYEQYWYSADKSGYSGTAVFTKYSPRVVVNGLPADIVEKYQLADQYGDTTKEGRVLVLEYETCFVATVYTPNAKEDLSRIAMRTQWDPAFLEYMKRLEEQKPVIMCGDFNVAHTEQDLARPQPNQGKKGFTQEERSGFSAFIDNGFIDTLREFYEGNGYYTWWSHYAKARERNVGWRIDYFLVSSKLKPQLKSAEIHPDIYGSDHCPASVELDLKL